MLFKKSVFKKRAGFSLVEIGVAATIAAMAATIGLYYQAQEVRYTIVRTQTDQLKYLAKAVYAYEEKYSKELIAGTDIPNFAIDLEPTLAELKAALFLDNSFKDTNLYAGTVAPLGTYKVKIRKAPTGCAAADCKLLGLVYMTTPVVDAVGNVDEGAAGQATLEGGDVAVSTSPDTSAGAGLGMVRGYQGMWAGPNPVKIPAGKPKAGLPQPGIIAIRAQYDPAAAPSAIPGSVTNNINMNNNAITGVDYVQGQVGQDLEIKTANGKDMYLQNINDTPNSDLYANFKTAYFMNDMSVGGNLFAKGTIFAYSSGPTGGGYALRGSAADGTLNAVAKSATGSIDVNDVYVRASGKWASELGAGSITTMSSPNIPNKSNSTALGTHKFCMLTQIDGTVNQGLTGTMNGAWTYTSSGTGATVRGVMCFD